MRCSAARNAGLADGAEIGIHQSSRDHADGGNEDVSAKTDPSDAVEIIAEIKRDKRAQSQEPDNLPAVLSDGFINSPKPRVLPR